MIGLSGEPIDVLRKKLVGELGAKFWLGSEKHADWILGYLRAGVGGGIPHHVLVDAYGTVVGHEVPDTEQLEALLAQVFDPELELDLHEALAAATAAYEAGAIGAARTLAAPQAAAAEGDVASDARLLLDRIERHAAWERRRLERELRGLEPPDAYGRLLVTVHSFHGTDLATWAREQVDQLTGNARVERDAKAWKALDDALAREMAAHTRNERGRAAELKRARQAYEKIAERHRTSAAATIARERAAAIAPAK